MPCSSLQAVNGYRFCPADLNIPGRRPGVSAFMRIRNGADWLELTVRSHMPYFDEIVAVYNQCTDATPEILFRLQREFGSQRLRVIHYEDPVHPPGSEGHATTGPDSPNSLVNYYNFALASTQYAFATKLDDDHLAIAETVRHVTDAIRNNEVSTREMLSFSGLNLCRKSEPKATTLGVLRSDPISGNGDIGFFRVTENTYFEHDRRFERFRRGVMKRRFSGFLYWHLKFLKHDMGFGNYELDKNPDSRYARRLKLLRCEASSFIGFRELSESRRPGIIGHALGVVSDKYSFIRDRDHALFAAFQDDSVAACVRRTAGEEHFEAFQRRLHEIKVS
jgi:hypothetical protein